MGIDYSKRPLQQPLGQHSGAVPPQSGGVNLAKIQLTKSAPGEPHQSR